MKPGDSVIRWLLNTQYPGNMPVDLGESEGQPSRWIPLCVLRVLDRYRGHAEE